MMLSYEPPAGWRFPTVEEIARPEKGSIRIGPFGSALKKHEYSDAGVRVLGIEDVLPNRLASDRRKFIPELKFRELSQYSVTTGDILVTNMGTVGRTCVVPAGLEQSIISSHLIKVSLEPSVAWPSYVSWMLNCCPLVVAQIEANCHGAIMAGFNTALLKQLRIPLPPLLEQRRIAEVLDRAEALRAMRRAALAQLDTLTQSIFLDMFGDAATNPTGVGTKPLGDHLLFITSGGRGWARFYAAHGSRFIRSLDVRMNQIGSDEIAFVAAPDNAEAHRTRVRAGDVLLTITGSRIGRVAPVPEELVGSYISQHVAILRLDTRRLKPEFLSFFLSLDRGGQRQIAKAQYGQTKPGLNFEQIRRFQVPVPPVPQQGRFAQRVDTVEKLKVVHRASLAELDALFTSLQHRAFRGEL